MPDRNRLPGSTFLKRPSSALSFDAAILLICSTPRLTFAAKTSMFRDTSAIGKTATFSSFGAQFPRRSDPDSDEKPPWREELCRVSVGDAQKFMATNNPLARGSGTRSKKSWQRIERVHREPCISIDVASGGYDELRLDRGAQRTNPRFIHRLTAGSESYRKDPQTFARYWQSLDQHTQDVVSAVTTLADALSLDPAMTAIFQTAALWHDVGKAHDEFQKALRVGPLQLDDAERSMRNLKTHTIRKPWPRSGAVSATNSLPRWRGFHAVRQMQLSATDRLHHRRPSWKSPSLHPRSA